MVGAGTYSVGCERKDGCSSDALQTVRTAMRSNTTSLHSSHYRPHAPPPFRHSSGIQHCAPPIFTQFPTRAARETSQIRPPAPAPAMTPRTSAKSSPPSPTTLTAKSVTTTARSPSSPAFAPPDKTSATRSLCGSRHQAGSLNAADPFFSSPLFDPPSTPNSPPLHLLS